MNPTIKTFAIVALICHALVAGTFFAFSTFVMPALNRMDSNHSIRAMQSINTTILSSAFMAVFGLSTLLSMALPIIARLNDGNWNPLLIIAALLITVGVFGVTMLGNVPLNDQLEKMKSASQWSSYFGSWMLWNHVRTLVGVIASALSCWALK